MITKGVILAGGVGTRLLPLTRKINKHCLPVGPLPMISHAVLKLVEADIREIIVVSGREHLGSLTSQLGSGVDYGCKFTYRVQDKPGGIAEALLLCEGLVCSSEHIVVILGDNIFEDSLGQYVDKYNSHIKEPFNNDDCMLLLKEVEDPRRFGVAYVDEDHLSKEKYILGIVEKPEHPKSNLAVTGLYFYPGTIFNMIRQLEYSDREELEISDLNNKFIPDHAIFDILTGFWTDAGTRGSYRKANELVWEKLDELSYLKGDGISKAQNL